ncbi:MAG: NAD-dependent epimerase/dehydratase family protein [wastewater metagenome]|nr:NAD-dependent epimerase/dehydratase family protein [Candidatus Loosdrechtia aerotolerans]
MKNKITQNNWLITGGCGFIGNNLIKRLIKDRLGKKICILDNLRVGTIEDLESVLIEFGNFSRTSSDTKINYTFEMETHSTIELLVGDIRNKKIVEDAIKDVNVVVHLAANTGVGASVENPIQDMEVNVTGTLNLLEASRKNHVKQFIFASSGATIGEVEPPVHEGKVPKPVSPYGASKLSGEGYCSAYYRAFGIKTISLRFGNVYGPLSRHKNSVVAMFMKRALNGKTLEIYGDGKQTRDFIYIDDLVDAIILASKTEIGGEVFQIATYKETTINEIADAVKELIEKETDEKVNIVYRDCRPGDVKRNFSDISKARKILGFEPKYDLVAGLRKTFECFVHK